MFLPMVLHVELLGQEHLMKNIFNTMNETIPNLVSTIIPVYNRPDMIQKAIKSVLEANLQTY